MARIRMIATRFSDARKTDTFLKGWRAVNETEQIWADWCSRDPSPYRLHIAAQTYNWDTGYDFLQWLVLNHDLDKATIALLISLIEPYDFAGVRTRDDVPVKVSELHLPGFNLMSSIMTRWNSGQFRKQEFMLSAHLMSFLKQSMPKFLQRAEAEGGLPWDLSAGLLSLQDELTIPDERRGIWPDWPSPAPFVVEYARHVLPPHTTTPNQSGQTSTTAITVHRP